jgi:hypothetical protein
MRPDVRQTENSRKADTRKALGESGSFTRPFPNFFMPTFGKQFISRLLTRFTGGNCLFSGIFRSDLSHQQGPQLEQLVGLVA